MAQPSVRLTAVAAATTAAAFAAAPALGSEPNVPPGAPPLPVLVLPNLAPLPSAPAHAKRPSIRRVRVVPRRIRRGKRARLRLILASPARLRIVVSRRTRGHRLRVRKLVVDAPAGAVSIRLPGRVRGHALAVGRYRVSVVAIDPSGNRSRTVRRVLAVRKRAH